jgi:hypothetical protein
VCISRLSSRRDAKVVAKLQENNQKLYDKYQRKIHPSIHECSDCPAEFKGLVFNGYSSNTNMSTYNAKPLKELKSILKEYAVRAIMYNNTAAIVFSQEDGLFTNVRGFKECFEPYEKYNITFSMYTGGSRFQHFSLREMLSTIRACEMGRRTDGACYNLLSSWVKISLNKENMAHMARDNKKMMPRSRNTIDDDSDEDPGVLPERVIEEREVVVQEYTKEAQMKRRQSAAEKNVKIKRYELEGDEDCMQCPEDGCSACFAKIEDLVNHVVKKCLATQICVLCPGNPEWTKKNAADGRKHIRYHLQATIYCDVEDCDYTARTSSALARHKKSHEIATRAKIHQCSQCDYTSDKPIRVRMHEERMHGDAGEDLVLCNSCGQHIKRRSTNSHKRDCPAQRMHHECAECKEIFDDYFKYLAHRHTIHERRDQVIAFAINAGFIQAGDMAKAASEIMG